MPKSICILSDDFSKVDLSSYAGLITCPEMLLNGPQMRVWVAELWEHERVFATNSIYLVREIDMLKVPVTFHNWVDGELRISDSVDDIGNIEILDRELEQSDRYLALDFREHKK